MIIALVLEADVLEREGSAVDGLDFCNGGAVIGMIESEMGLELLRSEGWAWLVCVGHIYSG